MFIGYFNGGPIDGTTSAVFNDNTGANFIVGTSVYEVTDSYTQDGHRILDYVEETE